MIELLREALNDHKAQQQAKEAVYGRFSEEIAARLWQQLPQLKQLCKEDVQTALASDPAAQSEEEVRECYPGIYAVQLHRLAHALWELGERRAAREMAEIAHSRTGIDIHPGAQIGGGFFIDHGTGVVIGQTAVIGRNVRLFHGVTLGALSVRDAAGQRGRKRHPTLCDGVVVCANATVLGGDTVVGEGSMIGANAFVTASLPPDSRVPCCAMVTGAGKKYGGYSEQLDKISTNSNHYDEKNGASADEAGFPLTNSEKSITL